MRAFFLVVAVTVTITVTVIRATGVEVRGSMAVGGSLIGQVACLPNLDSSCGAHGFARPQAVGGTQIRVEACEEIYIIKKKKKHKQKRKQHYNSKHRNKHEY